MADLKVCRICLCKGVKVYNYNKNNLKQYYEQILGSKVNYKDGLPHYFCYVCAAMLYKFHKFKEKCHTGQKALQELLWRGTLTLQAISQTERQDKNLKFSLEIISVGKRVKTYTFEHKSLTKSDSSNSNHHLHKKKLAKVKTGIVFNKDKKCTRNKRLKDEIEISYKSEDEKVLSDDEDDVTNISGDENFNSEDEKNEVDEILVKEEELKNQTIVVEENIIHDTVTGDEKTAKDNHKSKKRKYQKGRKKDYIEENTKKFAVCTERKETRDLDPKHWLKLTLNEEEAFTEFKAKAHDPKYLSAPYKCTDCFRGFSVEDILTRHIKLRHCQSLGPIECRFCKMRFRRKCLLNRHAKQHYARYKCLRCDLTCPLAFSAFAHNEYHNGVIRKCAHCGEEFRHSSTYYTHLRTHRSEHVCTLCGASFVSKLGVQMHKKIKHVITEINPGEEVNTFCQRCDIKFETRKAFEEHLSHSVMHAESAEDLGNEPPLSTDKKPAPKKASRPLETHRNPRKITPCNICNKIFSSKEAYIKHHKAEHKDEPLPFVSPKPEVKRVICEICGASIAVGSIAIHVNTHTREKLFPCATCSMQFNCKSSLTRHQLTHTGKKRYGCTLCDKRFTQNCSLKLHVRTVHLKEPYPYKRNRNKKPENQQELSVLEDYYQRSEFFGKYDLASD